MKRVQNTIFSRVSRPKAKNVDSLTVNLAIKKLKLLKNNIKRAMAECRNTETVLDKLWLSAKLPITILVRKHIIEG